MTPSRIVAVAAIVVTFLRPYLLITTTPLTADEISQVWESNFMLTSTRLPGPDLIAPITFCRYDHSVFDQSGARMSSVIHVTTTDSLYRFKLDQLQHQGSRTSTEFTLGPPTRRPKNTTLNTTGSLRFSTRSWYPPLDSTG